MMAKTMKYINIFFVRSRTAGSCPSKTSGLAAEVWAMFNQILSIT